MLEDARTEIELIYGSPMSVVSDCLRGFLVSKEQHDLIACDFSNIEGRTLAWLSGEAWKLKAFSDFDKGLGPDIYKLSAHRIYGTPVEKIDSNQRLIGKVAELALGYQGGKGAFHSMAKVYLVKVPDAQADEIKMAWRQAHPKTVSYWNDLNEAAQNAVRYPGKIITTGPEHAPVRYKVAGSFLLCCLPSTRVLCYSYPEIWQQVWASVKTMTGKKVAQKTFHGKTLEDCKASIARYVKINKLQVVDVSDPQDCMSYMGEDSYTGKWERQIAYGGLLANNVTQATARDVFVEAMFRVEKKGYPIVMHTHDEIVCEIKNDFGSIDEMADVMSELPSWAQGLPVAVGDPKERGWRGKRYRK